MKSKLEELIEKLCPNGVEYKELNKILDYEQPTKYIVKHTNYNDNYEIPVLTAGQSFILGYTNETTGIYGASKENPVIIFDDFTTSFHWVDFNFKIKSSAMKFLKLKKENEVVFRYIFHCMRNINYKPVDHSRQWIEKYSKIEIPLPPLKIQEEIVRILDKFTELTTEIKDELTKELTLRKQQYEHYRGKLLNFKDNGNILIGNRIQYEELNKILDYEQPTKYIVKDTNYNDDYKIPVLTAGQSFILGYTNEIIGIYEANKEDPVIIFDDFTTSFHWVDFKFKIKSSAMKLLKLRKEKVDNISFRYIYYYMKNIYYTPADHSRQWIGKYSKIEIPLPPLEEQKRIVEILDRFDKYINDIKEGLPAEIEMRQKQYEYYRDKLLNFKKLNVEG